MGIATDSLRHMEMVRKRAAEYTRPANVDSVVETRVIKEKDLFMLTDVDGNVPVNNRQGLGLYLRDTRFLSTYDLRLDGQLRPTVLFSSAERNCLLSVDATNPDITGETGFVQNQTININRSRLVDNAVYERITFINYGGHTVNLPVSLAFDADYKDIFEVRGYALRQQRGEMLSPTYDERSLTLSYRGLDGVMRRTQIRFQERPDVLEDQCATFHLNLAPREAVTIYLVIIALEGDVNPQIATYDHARYALEASYSDWLKSNTYVTTTSDIFDKMFRRSTLDLRLLMTDTEWGPVVTAGTPWYACVFGRDSLITALQSLMFCPDLARATLRMLAHHQGSVTDEWREEEPGKIFHELRRGEMARLKEVPHTPYFGTSDATPLWLILLAETFRWTGDRELVDELWEPAMRALHWIDNYGDGDGDGYVEYYWHGPGGTVNQAWKDSPVAVFHADGSLAEQPIAMIEIQGYVYAAKRGMADLTQMRGDSEAAARLRAEADILRKKLNQDFWIEERNFFASALDGQKRQVKTMTSNPGQALWSGVVEPDLARRLIPHFKRSDFLSGWGLRCVSEGEVGYNPMGYHLGTVWPHDVSIIIAGLRRYGYSREALTIGTQLYNAGLNSLYYRLPEVFTGFSSSQNPFPVPYPVSCTPQAWSAGTTLLMLQTILGLYPDAGNHRVTLDPALPNWLSECRISNLHIGDATLDLRFTLHGEYSTGQVLSKRGRLDVMI
jgi:glycogen debranching enzyme